MTIKCPQKDCWAPEIVCNLGYDLDQCPHYKGEEAKEGNQSSSEDAFLLPWSGNSFGTVDLQFVAGRSKPTLIGVVGAHKAGKTTLLTTLYLLLGRGQRPIGARFAGSYTLGGWEILAQFLRWKPNQAPSFPPHTPFNASRTPGLLHLAFRGEDGYLQDVLLTDAPGELFTRWAIDKTATELESARWIARHADAFLLVVDSEALAGPRRGEARTSTLALAERLGDELTNRPAGVVWAKSDVALKDSVRRALDTSFAKLFPLRKEFHVSVQREDGRSRVTEEAFLDLLSWLLPSRIVIGVDPLTLAVQRADDPMIAFRG
jgi:hypothetical protein